MRTASRPTEVDASWLESDRSPLASTTVLDLSPGPMNEQPGGSPGETKDPSTSDAVFPVPRQAKQPRLAVGLTGAPSLASKWLAESRSPKGLADQIGPLVYGNGDRSPGQIGSAGSGNGSGAGAGDGDGSKSSFFGIPTTGRTVVYLVDASSSMNRPYKGEAKTRFGQMKLELTKSILGLKEEQKFFIIFFNEHSIPMPADGPENALPQNQRQFLTWVAGVTAFGLTDPRPALELAFSMRPDVIYLLTDGTFPRDVDIELRLLNQRFVEINTIAFGDAKAEKSLKPLALRNRGRFAFVP